MRSLWPLWIAVGVLVRLVIWYGTIGSNDVPTWASHGHHVGTLGLVETYRTVQLYNHPPLLGWYAMAAWDLANHDMAWFARLIKLPALLGEALALVALWRLGGLRLAGWYALMPAPILVAAYHGNTDCLYAAFALLAAIAWDKSRWALAGVAMAAALNVKLIPLLLVPLFVIGAPSRRALWQFSLGLSVGLLPYLPPVLQAGDAMYRNMIAYNSSGDEWGFMAFLNEAERSPAIQAISVPLRELFLKFGRYLILGGSVLLAIACRRRLRMTMREQVAVVAGLFLFFAPGFGVQYVAFIAPLLLAVHVGAGVFWGIASGLFIGALYATYLVRDPLWYSAFYAPFPGITPELGVIPWAGLGCWLWWHLSDAWRASASAMPPASATAVLAPR